jgi:simple sugar transport system permease protein
MNAQALRRSPVVAAVVAVLLAALLSGLLLGVLGIAPLRALQALLEGAVGDRLAVENTLLRSGPLLLIGLGIALSFRCGVWNIGAEGQLYAGAIAGTAVATRLFGPDPGPAALPLALVAGALGGALWGGVAALLRVTRGVSEVLSTILLNFVAVLGVAYVVHGPLKELAGAYPQSDALSASAQLPILPGLLRVHAALPLVYLLPLVAWVLLFRTAAGLRLRAVGLNPEAARYAGISPDRETVRVLLLSGGLAGLAGAIEVCGVTGRLFENLSPGYGFTAIAVALLARLNPLGVVPAALLFAGLATGSGAMQRVANVPSVTVQVVEALVILLSVGFALPRRNG